MLVEKFLEPDIVVLACNEERERMRDEAMMGIGKERRNSADFATDPATTCKQNEASLHTGD
jgi:hypothetical protein